VRERHDLEPAVAAEPVEETEHEVAGQAEHVAHAGALQIGDDEVAQLHARLEAAARASRH
jgi:hypothetical protein